jgi:hypothetical protein
MSPDVAGRRTQVPVRRGYEYGRKARKQGQKNCDYARDGMAVARKSRAFLALAEFELGQAVLANSWCLIQIKDILAQNGNCVNSDSKNFQFDRDCRIGEEERP